MNIYHLFAPFFVCFADQDLLIQSLISSPLSRVTAALVVLASVLRNDFLWDFEGHGSSKVVVHINQTRQTKLRRLGRVETFTPRVPKHGLVQEFVQSFRTNNRIRRAIFDVVHQVSNNEIPKRFLDWRFNLASVEMIPQRNPSVIDQLASIIFVLDFLFERKNQFECVGFYSVGIHSSELAHVFD